MAISNRYSTPWNRTAEAVAASTLPSAHYSAVLLGMMVAGVLLSISAGIASHRIGDPLIASIAGVAAVIAGIEITIRTPNWPSSLAGHIVANAAIGLLVGPWVLSIHAPVVLVAASLSISLLTLFVLSLIFRDRSAYVEASRKLRVRLAACAAPAGLVVLYFAKEPLTLYSISISLAVYLYFAAYWLKGHKVDLTMNNAIDSACAVYLDAANRLLGLLEKLSPAQYRSR